MYVLRTFDMLLLDFCSCSEHMKHMCNNSAHFTSIWNICGKIPLMRIIMSGRYMYFEFLTK